MKNIIVNVKIWAVSDPDLDEADISFMKQFKIGNWKVPLPDILYELSLSALEAEYPHCEFVDFEVIDYSAEPE